MALHFYLCLNILIFSDYFNILILKKKKKHKRKRRGKELDRSNSRDSKFEMATGDFITNKHVNNQLYALLINVFNVSCPPHDG
jgi:acyl-ACP thioesterase